MLDFVLGVAKFMSSFLYYLVTVPTGDTAETEFKVLSVIPSGLE